MIFVPALFWTDNVSEMHSFANRCMSSLWCRCVVRHKAEPSTIYQVYRCINLNKKYCDIPTIILSTMEQSATSPATNNTIRGAEQSGNIAKQRFARKGVKG